MEWSTQHLSYLTYQEYLTADHFFFLDSLVWLCFQDIPLFWSSSYFTRLSRSLFTGSLHILNSKHWRAPGSIIRSLPSLIFTLPWRYHGFKYNLNTSDTKFGSPNFKSQPLPSIPDCISTCQLAIFPWMSKLIVADPELPPSIIYPCLVFPILVNGKFNTHLLWSNTLELFLTLFFSHTPHPICLSW